MTDYTKNPEQDVAFGTESDRTESHKDLSVNAPDWFNRKEYDDDDVVSDFADAMLKLEELVYAIYGGIPDYTDDTPWYERDNPRCLWPEQMTTNRLYDPYAEKYDYHQYPATGCVTNLGYTTDQQIGAPVPIRTRSGDPRLQYAMATHESMFAEGSVERDSSIDPFDPANDTVEVRWTPSASVNPTTVTLKTSVADYAMSKTGDTWKATIPAQDQGDVIHWYIELVNDEGDPVTYYEPKNPAGGAPAQRTPPDDPHDRLSDARYTYVSYEHDIGPYGYGFPELIERLGGPDDDPPGLRKGTETWKFDSMEDIQIYHINAARFLLDAIGRDTEHSPLARGDPENCCVFMPIYWRWTGTNKHWQYEAGGKGGTSEVSPLHGLDDDDGDEAARRSWRGLPMLFKEDDPFNEGWTANFEYGSDESWLTVYDDVWSDQVIKDGETPGYLYDSGRHAGLQPGDCIDVVHLKEIIAAVDYLIDNGVWRTEEIHSSWMSPMTAHGKQCGWYWDTIFGDRYRGCDNECCAECDHPRVMPDDCVPYDPPDYENCTGHNRCLLEHHRDQHCEDDTPSTYEAKHVFCGDIGPDPYNAGGGLVSYMCALPAWQDCALEEWAWGWSAYLCGPEQSSNGPGHGVHGNGNPKWSVKDTNHGNTIRKLRRKDDPPGGLLNPNIRSHGNNYVTVVHCRLDTGNPGHVSVGFEQVTGVKWEGMATNWIGEASCTEGVYMTGIPWSAIPGLGYFEPDGETPLCWTLDYLDEGGDRVTKGACEVDETMFDRCKGETCYVKIDLNLQNGIPRLKDYATGIYRLDDQGDPIEPTEYEHSDCPCATDPDLTDKPCGS